MHGGNCEKSFLEKYPKLYEFTQNITRKLLNSNVELSVDDKLITKEIRISSNSILVYTLFSGYTCI